MAAFVRIGWPLSIGIAGRLPSESVAALPRIPQKALERGNRELRQANEILRKASAYFAMADLDRRSKP
ncbi:transposase-like protein [Bradyrhizobium sp. JR1.5]